MGNKKDAKSILAVIDKSIYDLESRIAVLKQEGDHKTGKRSEKTKQELATLTRQLEYVRTAKKMIEEEMKRVKKEEERRKLESILKYVMLVGVISENLRIREAQERVPLNRTQDALLSLAEAADDLFLDEDFRFVLREDVDGILEDQELQEMAEMDPNRLEREEEDMRAEYERMIEKSMQQYSQKLAEADFEEKEKRFRDILKKANGFEEVLSRSGQFVKEIVPVIGTEEDKAFFTEVMMEVEELGGITRQLQEDYLLGNSSFEKGNGYTKELIEREKQLMKKIEDYGDQKLNGEHGILTMDPEAQETQYAMRIYERSQMMLTPIRLQVERDVVMQRNNELREKMERWKVYTRLTQARDKEIAQIPESEDNRRKAWAKLQRMEKNAVMRNMAPDAELSETELNERKKSLEEGRGGLLEDTAIWAAAEIQTLLEQISDPERLKALDKNMVQEKLAALVLHQIISDEMKRPYDEPRPYYEELRVRRNQFQKMAKELAATKEFQAALKPYIRNKRLGEDCILFLAQDKEKPVAAKLGGLKRKLGPQPAAKKRQ